MNSDFFLFLYITSVIFRESRMVLSMSLVHHYSTFNNGEQPLINYQTPADMKSMVHVQKQCYFVIGFIVEICTKKLQKVRTFVIVQRTPFRYTFLNKFKQIVRIYRLTLHRCITSKPRIETNEDIDCVRQTSFQKFYFIFDVMNIFFFIFSTTFSTL